MKKNAARKPKTAPSAPLTAAQLQSMGGKARMKQLSKKQRVEQARKAIETRWKKYREAKQAANDETPPEVTK